MKKNKKYLLVFILLLMPFVVKAEELVIKSVEETEREERVEIEDDTIYFNDYDEYVSYNVVLENPTNKKLQVTSIETNGSSCVSIDYNELKDVVVDANSTKEIGLTFNSNKCGANEEEVYTLSFLSKEVKSGSNNSNTTTNNSSSKENNIVSPNTYGNVPLLIIILAVMTLAYIGFFIYSRKKVNNYMKLSSIVYLSLVAVTIVSYSLMTTFSAGEERAVLSFAYTYEPQRVLRPRIYTMYADATTPAQFASDDAETIWENAYRVVKVNISNAISEPDDFDEDRDTLFDASLNGDGSIMVYRITIEPPEPEEGEEPQDPTYELYIMADGKIITPEDSSYLLSGFNIATEVSGLSNLDTSVTKNMQGFFLKDYKIADSINVSTFDTSNVTNMAGMFYGFNTPINGFASWDTSKVTDMSYMFAEDWPTVNIDLSHLDTSNVTTMKGMFYKLGRNNGQEGLVLDVSHFDTSKVTDMSDMFNFKDSKTLIGISGLEHFDTSKVTNMASMFRRYKGPIKLNLSSFDTSKVENMNSMFATYGSDQPLDVSNFSLDSILDMQYIFNTYSSTGELDISGFEFTTVPNNFFSGALNAEKVWVKTEAMRTLLINKYTYATEDNIFVKGDA